MTARIESKDGGAASRGPDEVQQQADGCGLARTVGPQEAEYLSPSDLQIEPFKATDGAVVLGQVMGLYDSLLVADGAHAHTILQCNHAFKSRQSTLEVW